MCNKRRIKSLLALCCRSKMFSITLLLHRQVSGATVFPFHSHWSKQSGPPFRVCSWFLFHCCVIFFPFDCGKRFATALNVRIEQIKVDWVDWVICQEDMTTGARAAEVDQKATRLAQGVCARNGRTCLRPRWRKSGDLTKRMRAFSGFASVVGGEITQNRRVVSPRKKGSYGKRRSSERWKKSGGWFSYQRFFYSEQRTQFNFLKLFGFRKRIFLSSHSSTCPLQQVASESTVISLSLSLLTADWRGGVHEYTARRRGRRRRRRRPRGNKKSLWWVTSSVKGWSDK